MNKTKKMRMVPPPVDTEIMTMTLVERPLMTSMMFVSVVVFMVLFGLVNMVPLLDPVSLFWLPFC